jgi:hypothetical protein
MGGQIIIIIDDVGAINEKMREALIDLGESLKPIVPAIKELAKAADLIQPPLHRDKQYWKPKFDRTFGGRR